MLCMRRGPAIDLVLSRATNRRAQFIFTVARGRPVIFWQTSKTAMAARPGLRIPRGRARTPQTYYVDTRERYGYTFAAYGATVSLIRLDVGDYAVSCGGSVLAAIERKTLEDCARSLTDGSLGFVMGELAALPHAAVVVEGTYSALLRHGYARPGFLPELLARLQVRNPTIPIVFLEAKRIAEDWTYRFLHAAYESAETFQYPLGDAGGAPAGDA